MINLPRETTICKIDFLNFLQYFTIKHYFIDYRCHLFKLMEFHTLKTYLYKIDCLEKKIKTKISSFINL